MVITDYIYIHTINDTNNIIINSLTGAIDIVNEQIATILKEKDIKRINLLDSDIINCLKDRGYIFNSHEELEELINKSYKKYEENSNYNIYSILPTYNCNLACTYCFEGTLTNNNECLTKEMVDNIFNYIKNDKKRFTNKNIIQFFGGEPLLKNNFSVIEQIFNYASDIDIDGIDIVTNGTQLNYFSDILLKYKSLIRSIQVTIDGPPSIHDKRRIKKDGSGTFNVISENIKKFLELGFSIIARTNVDNTNIDYLRDLVEYYDNTFKVHNNFKYYFAPVRANCSSCSKDILNEEQLLEKLQLLRGNDDITKYPLEGIKVLAHVKNVLETNKSGKKVMPMFHYCEAVNGRQTLFAPDGKLYTCGQAVGHDKLSIGSFYPDICIDEFQLKKWENLSILNKKKCSTCSISLICGGGCVSNSWNNTNELDNPLECSETFNVLSTYLYKYKEKNNL